MRVPIGGGPVAELASGQDEPQRLAVKDGFVFWTDRGSGQHDGTVKKVGLGGGAVTTLATQQSYPFDVAVGQGAVYWTDADDGTVMKIAATGGVPVTLATGQKGIGPLRVRDDGVYWLAGGSVLRASLDGRTISTLFRRARPRFEGSLRLDLQADLAVDETSVYWVDGAEIISVSRGAGPAHWLVAERQPEEIRGLAVLAGDLYWGSPMIVARDSPATSQFKIAEAHGFALMKRSLAGGSSEALAYFSGGPYSHEVDRIAVDATSIYWADEKSGIVGKLTPR